MTAYITNLLTMFVQFFFTGLFAVGGGLATLPFLNNMADRFPEWFTRSDLADMIAVSESTPGPIGVNMATFAGFKVGGVLGAMLATCALVLPSIIIIIIVAKMLERFSSNPLVQNSFYGLRPAMVGLTCAAGLQVINVSLFDITSFMQNYSFALLFRPKAIILFAVLLFMIFKMKKLHPIAFIAIGAVVGIVVQGC